MSVCIHTYIYRERVPRIVGSFLYRGVNGTQNGKAVIS